MSQKLIDLIRIVLEPKNFDPTVHGPGYHLIHDAGAKDEEARVSSERVPLPRRLIGKNSDFTHYFVKKLPKPLELTGWRFRWAEASRRMDLELDAGIDLHVADLEQAKTLVSRLHSPEGPEKALHALIDSALHAELRERARKGKNLLDAFLPESRQTQGDPLLSQAVSESVGRSLGGVSFSIGFSLETHPPRQLEIIEHETIFKTSDTPPNLQKVLTTAQIELESYQDFKQSGLKNEDDLERAIKAVIDAAVKRHLFSKPYYAIAASFDNSTDGHTPIREQIRSEILQKVSEWGYGVRLFHTLPDIAALLLARGVRVEVLDKEYRTQRSIGVVKMDVSVQVTARHFDRVAELIPPADAKSKEAIQAKLSGLLLEVCRDQVLKIDRRRFNLEFESAEAGKSSVVDQLTAAFDEALDKRYGLRVDVINIVQQPTEDAERFNCVRGAGAWPFTLNLSSRGNAGTRDAVQITGEFEVLAMGRNGWETFESKDFGFRRDSGFWTPSRWDEFQKQIGPGIVITSDDRERERQAYAVRKELEAIAGRITSLLTDALKSLPDLALRSRDYKNLRNLESWASNLVLGKIEDEFGLVIKLRKFERQDTATELSNAVIHSEKHKAIRGRAAADAQHALAMADVDRNHRQSRKQLLLDRLSDLNDRDPDDATRKADETAIRAELAELDQGADWGAISGEALSNALADEASDTPPTGLLGDELGPARRRALPK